MASRYYIDTAIWRDLHENRKDKSKNLGEFAFLRSLIIFLKSKKV